MDGCKRRQRLYIKRPERLQSVQCAQIQFHLLPLTCCKLLWPLVILTHLTSIRIYGSHTKGSRLKMKWNPHTVFALSPSLSLSFPSFLPPVLEMGRCEFSASRWAWWACATPTSKRSTNVSATLAGVPNASPQLQTMSQQQQKKSPTALIARII